MILKSDRPLPKTIKVLFDSAQHCARVVLSQGGTFDMSREKSQVTLYAQGKDHVRCNWHN